MRSFLLIGALALGSPAVAQEVDIMAIFNCGDGAPLGNQTSEQCGNARNLLLNNCTSCHTFVPIVKAQKSENEWTSLLAGHRERVLHMSDDEFQTLGEFLKSHFNETEPVPALPAALEALSSNQPA